MTHARLLLSWKEVWPDGFISEGKIWLLPEPTPERRHGLKYSLFFGRPGERIIGYDNETGKGDHRHYRDREEPYLFVSLHRLMADFDADVKRETGNG